MSLLDEVRLLTWQSGLLWKGILKNLLCINLFVLILKNMLEYAISADMVELHVSNLH